MGSGKREIEKMDRIGNQVTDRARVLVTFCSQFSFSRSPLPVSLLLTSLLGALNSHILI